MARPRKEIDFEQLESLCRLQVTAEEAADFFDISADTLDRRIKEHGYAGFAEFYKMFFAEGKVSLRRAQYTAATGGNVTMLVWLGKQWLGQRDYKSAEISGPDGQPIAVENKLAFDPSKLSTQVLTEIVAAAIDDEKDE